MRAEKTYCAEMACCTVQMMDYNTPHGKLNRGMAVLDTFKAIKQV